MHGVDGAWQVADRVSRPRVRGSCERVPVGALQVPGHRHSDQRSLQVEFFNFDNNAHVHSQYSEPLIFKNESSSLEVGMLVCRTRVYYFQIDFRP